MRVFENIKQIFRIIWWQNNKEEMFHIFLHSFQTETWLIVIRHLSLLGRHSGFFLGIRRYQKEVHFLVSPGCVIEVFHCRNLSKKITAEIELEPMVPRVPKVMKMSKCSREVLCWCDLMQRTLYLNIWFVCQMIVCC